jgi:hypothetical protein
MTETAKLATVVLPEHLSWRKAEPLPMVKEGYKG